jgi:hypothetical protein
MTKIGLDDFTKDESRLRDLECVVCIVSENPGRSKGVQAWAIGRGGASIMSSDLGLAPRIVEAFQRRSLHASVLFVLPVA